MHNARSMHRSLSNAMQTLIFHLNPALRSPGAKNQSSSKSYIIPIAKPKTPSPTPRAPTVFTDAAPVFSGGAPLVVEEPLSEIAGAPDVPL